MTKIPHRAFAGMACAAVAFMAASAQADDILIGLTGMNLVYDGSSLFDAGSINGGAGNPGDADSLASVDFFVNGGLVGSLSNDISLDVFIPDVTNIPSAAGAVYNQSTPGTNFGFFDLLIGTSPLASEFLLVNLASVNITYVDVLNQVQFTFGAALGSVFAQNLPFGVSITDPITVSFSAQLVPGTRTSAGGFITGFEAAGTGEFAGVPAPGTAALLAMGALVMRRRRA